MSNKQAFRLTLIALLICIFGAGIVYDLGWEGTSGSFVALSCLLLMILLLIWAKSGY